MMSFFALAIGAVASVAFAFQISLWVRYSFGSLHLRKWGRKMQEVPDQNLLVTLMCGRSGGSWLEPFLRQGMAYLGIANGAFRIEYALNLLEDSEERLLRHSFAKFCLGGMMVFGLAGTFYAFFQLISSSGLTDALKAISNGENLAVHYSGLSASFLEIYRGFGNAFVSSLAGLLATLVLVFVDQVVVTPARIRFLHRWAFLAHDWESRLLPAQNGGDDSRAHDEQNFAPAVLITPSESIDAAALPIHTANEEKWDALLKALQDSHLFFDRCLGNLTEAGVAQREEMQKLVADVVMSMRLVVSDLGEQVSKVSEAKATHLKKVEDNIESHFQNRERIWEDKLQVTLDGFTKATADASHQAQSTLDGCRKDALEAGERVAKAVRREAQEALELISNNQKALQQGQLELLKNCQATEALLSSVSPILNDHKNSLDSYISELTLSLKSWKNAPKAIDDTIKQVTQTLSILADAIKNMSTALNKTAQLPSRWEAEIADLSGLFSEIADRRKTDSVWYKVKLKVKAWLRGRGEL